MVNGMGQANAGTSSAGQGFISTMVARMPYTHKVLHNAVESNPKFDIFDSLQSKKDIRVRNQSVFQDQDGVAGGQVLLDKRYHQIMYADVDTDKVRRIQEYRKMAGYSELADCIDEISDEAIVKDMSTNEVIQLEVRGEHDKLIVDSIRKEWYKFINAFDIENRGWELVRKFLVEGEVYFENIISQNRPDYGIIGFVEIPSELINPIYDNTQNQIIQGFLLRKPMVNPKRNITNQTKEELVVFDKNQVTYCNSGLWNEDHSIRLPFIENSRRAYKQLSLIEDSIIIYRLVRAPERLVFKVDVGNMPVPKAEEYVKKLMQQYWARKNFDNSKGNVGNVYAPQSMLDAFWFTKRGGQDGTTVEQLAGGQNLGQLDDLMYFVKKLYKSLRVPVSRLDPQDPFKDGMEITREELRFSRFIIRIQEQIAKGLKNSFISHLKLREKRLDDPKSESLWRQFKLREHQIHLMFNMPTSFAVLRDQQIFNLKKENYNGLITSEMMSQSFCQKYYLGMTVEQMSENREWLRKDAALQWEIQNIASEGPNFREHMAAEQEIDSVMDGGMPMGGGGGADFSPDIPPDFGTGPEMGGGAGAEPQMDQGGGEQQQGQEGVAQVVNNQ